MSVDYWNKGGFVLCTGGSAELKVGEQPFRLEPGCVFMVFPLTQPTFFCPSADYRELSFLCDLNVFYPIFQQIADTEIPLRMSEMPCWHLSEEEQAYALRQSDRIRSKQDRSAFVSSQAERLLLEQQLRLIFHETLLEITANRIRCLADSSLSARKPMRTAYRFILDLHANCDRQRAVSWYAMRAKLSPGYFSAQIREATGRTPSQWIGTVTTDYARLLLGQSGMSVKEVAEKLHFPEQFTFRKYFKTNTGQSPTEYRCSRHISLIVNTLKVKR